MASTSTILALTLKPTVDGTEIIEISENGTGSFRTTLSAIVANYQLLSQKGAINGYAALDASQKLLLTNFPTGIDAANLADGTVSNTEFQFINSLTSNAQTQLNLKPETNSTLWSEIVATDDSLENTHNTAGHSNIITHNGKQYIAYYDVNGFITLGERAITATTRSSWTFNKLNATNPKQLADFDDNHDDIAMQFDDIDILHISWGMHNDPLLYFRMPTANTIVGTPGVNLSMLGTNENDVTYPFFFKRPSDGKLFFTFRNTLLNRYLYQYDSGTTTWTAAAGTSTAGLFVQAPGTGDFDRTYLSRPWFVGDVAYFSWNWMQSVTGQGHNPFFFKYDTLNGTFSQADGTTQTIPVTSSNEDRIATLPPASHVGITTMGHRNIYVDSAGKIFVIFAHNDSNSVKQLNLYTHDGGPSDVWSSALQITSNSVDQDIEDKDINDRPHTPLLVDPNTEIFYVMNWFPEQSFAMELVESRDKGVTWSRPYSMYGLKFRRNEFNMDFEFFDSTGQIYMPDEISMDVDNGGSTFQHSSLTKRFLYLNHWVPAEGKVGTNLRPNQIISEEDVVIRSIEGTVNVGSEGDDAGRIELTVHTSGDNSGINIVHNGGSLLLGDNSNQAGTMKPCIIAKPIGNDTRHFLERIEIPVSEDSGTEPAKKMHYRTSTPGLIGTRPLVSAFNHTTKIYEIAANGDWNFQGNNLSNIGFMDMPEISTPANPDANIGRLYVKDLATVTTLFFRDNTGTETNLLLGGGGGGITTLNTLTATTQTFAVAQADELAISSVTSTHTFSVGANIPRLDESNTFTANNRFDDDISIGGAVDPGIDILILGAKIGGTGDPGSLSRGVRIQNVVTLTAPDSTNGYDYEPTISVATTADHSSGYQCRQIIDGGGTIAAIRGYMCNFVINSGSAATEARGFRYFDPDTGSGTLVDNYGYWCETLNKGTGLNFAWFSEDGNVHRFGGLVDVIDTAGSSTIRATRYVTSAGSSGNLALRKARGSETTPTIVLDGDRLGLIAASGYDGSSFENAARIIFEADGSFSDGVSSPGRIVFLTTPSGSLTPTERWILKNDGTVENFVFNANGTGNSLSNVDVADLANGVDGELITWDAAGVPTTVAVGTNAQVLTSNGPGAAPTFQTNPAGFTDPMTTRGDIIIRNPSNVTDRLAIGANTFVLTSDGTDISWGAAGSGDVTQAGTNVMTGSTTFKDNTLFLENQAGNQTGQFQNTNTATRTYTLQDSNHTIVGRDTTDTLTNKTLTTPTIASFTNATHNHQAAAGGGTLLSTSALSDTADIAYLNTANIFIAGNKNTFAHSGTTAGLNVAPVAGTPSGQANGDIWLNVTSQQLFARINGADVDLGGSSFAEAGIPLVIDGGGSVIAAGVKGDISIPFDCIVKGWVITSKISGSIVVDINKSTFAGYPTLTTIAGSELPTLSSANKNEDQTLTTWTETLTKGDIVEWEVDGTPTSVERVTVTLLVDRT